MALLCSAEFLIYNYIQSICCQYLFQIFILIEYTATVHNLAVMISKQNLGQRLIHLIIMFYYPLSFLFVMIRKFVLHKALISY